MENDNGLDVRRTTVHTRVEVLPKQEGRALIHPFDHHDFIAGHGSMGLEILEDAPDTKAIIAAVGGGGLIAGVGSAVKALRSDIKIIAAEPETAAPFARSLAAGLPQDFPEWTASFVDGAGGRNVIPRMWERMRPVTDAAIVVSLEQVRAAMRLMAEKARIIAEGAGALPLASRSLSAARWSSNVSCRTRRSELKCWR